METQKKPRNHLRSDYGGSSHDEPPEGPLRQGPSFERTHGSKLRRGRPQPFKGRDQPSRERWCSELTARHFSLPQISRTRNKSVAFSRFNQRESCIRAWTKKTATFRFEYLVRIEGWRGTPEIRRRLGGGLFRVGDDGWKLQDKNPSSVDWGWR